MPYAGVSDVVRRKALSCGAEAWLAALPELVAALEEEWAIEVGPPFASGSEAYVAEARSRRDGAPSVLKLLLPLEHAPHEITALRLADGSGCARLLRCDAERSALLLERLGEPLCALGLPLAERLEILGGTAQRVWRPAAGSGLPSGAWKGRWLVDYVEGAWPKLGRPCSERAVDYALECARRRVAAHDDGRAVLVHGDVHQWNTLRALDGSEDWKLVDPDGLFAEPEYDLGILMREDPLELMSGDPRARSRALAARTGLSEPAIWEWGAIERLSTGLLCTEIELQPFGREMLAAADRVCGHEFRS